MNVSTAFYPLADTFPGHKADIVILSSDTVFFYVHAIRLLNASSNAFNSLLSSDPPNSQEPEGTLQVVPVPEASPVINILLHAIYEIPSTTYRPSDEVLIASVDALPTYGISLQRYLVPSSALFRLLLERGQNAPLAFYSLAGRHDLYDLAAPLSAMLLSSDIPEEAAEQMGAVYLARLIRLRYARLEALKAVLADPPQKHEPVNACSAEDQERLRRAWILTAAYYIFAGRPGAWLALACRRLASLTDGPGSEITYVTLEIAFQSLSTHLKCDQCSAALSERVAQVVADWKNVKVR